MREGAVREEEVAGEAEVLTEPPESHGHGEGGSWRQQGSADAGKFLDGEEIRVSGRDGLGERRRRRGNLDGVFDAGPDEIGGGHLDDRGQAACGLLITDADYHRWISGGGWAFDFLGLGSCYRV